MNRRPRLLFITRNFPPLTGGIERLAYHALQALDNQFDTLLIGPVGSAEYTSNSYSVALPTQPNWRFFFSFFHSGISAARKFRPDIIVAASGAVAPCALVTSKLLNVRFITLVHGLDIVYPSSLYQILFGSSIRLSDSVIANSHNTARLARAAGITPDKLLVLNPAVSVESPPVGEPAIESNVLARKGSILLSVGRLVRRKGLLAFIKMCLPAIVEKEPQVMLLIVGEESEHVSSQNFSILEEIKAAISAASLENNVCILGRLSDKELAQMYAFADVHVFPVFDLPGDVEGFGMVALEAAAYGCPTIAFSAGGVADAVKDGVSGKLIEAGNYSAFASAVIRLLQGEEIIDAAECRTFASEFTWERYGGLLSQACMRLVLN